MCKFGHTPYNALIEPFTAGELEQRAYGLLMCAHMNQFCGAGLVDRRGVQTKGVQLV